MKDTNLLEEYVLNDQGAVFQGSSDHIGAKVWNFAQVLFEPSFDIWVEHISLTNDAKRIVHKFQKLRVLSFLYLDQAFSSIFYTDAIYKIQMHMVYNMYMYIYI